MGSFLTRGCSEKQDGAYGVFLGVDGSGMDRLKGYELLVIDSQNFTKEEMEELKDNNGIVYSYLNVGALENFRDYYHDYAELGFGHYENWEEEIWMDVSSGVWQEFVVNQLSADLVEKGAEGFFIDNLDVYYEYPDEAIYRGILRILEGLKKWEKPLMVNGGDVFVQDYMTREASPIGNLIAGVNQETVLTSILFSEGKLGRQEAENTEYFKEYLRMCKDAGLSVYLLEYTGDRTLEKEVRDYCRQEGITCYITDSIELNKIP